MFSARGFFLVDKLTGELEHHKRVGTATLLTNYMSLSIAVDQADFFVRN